MVPLKEKPYDHLRPDISYVHSLVVAVCGCLWLSQWLFVAVSCCGGLCLFLVVVVCGCFLLFLVVIDCECFVLMFCCLAVLLLMSLHCLGQVHNLHVTISSCLPFCCFWIHWLTELLLYYRTGLLTVLMFHGFMKALPVVLSYLLGTCHKLVFETS